MTEPDVPTIDLFDLGSRGLQHHGLRLANERAVLTVVAINPGLSNAEIARISGLAPQTVSAILTEIEGAGLIERGEVLRGRRGQPATPIFLKASGAYSIGIELGWRHADIMIINLGVEVVAHRHVLYEEADLSALAPRLASIIAELTCDWSPEQRERLDDIGVCCPGTIHSALAPLSSEAGSKSGPTQTLFADELSRLTELDVTLFNDGNAACWAELIAQPSPRPGTFVYLLVSTYLAAGVLGEGRLWQGGSGHSVDLGSMLVVAGEQGLKPAHSVASVAVLTARLRAAGFALDWNDPESWDWPAIEAVVGLWIEDCAEAMALVVHNTSAVIEAGLIVVDTILPELITERLVERVAAHFAALPVRHETKVVRGHVGRLAPALGAAELPLYRRYFSRSLLHQRD
ncbi:Sugar kinase of the NBD/HSP70 family, may contain an N-terminal HTH domain [Devosia crocina]|uniref:Sugar kinase of the NBD/HSP70 family, may contain an N-terminal HTH domain n=1 Tax=Devosia crocina TaxID=429728 RepID=A0A1I7NUD5_9HYPH|nr:ROK family transcriptional regulator [Devosia crocina]SFV38264.1 Sugar kinase of the NBD/HSP70 family, may contain an N-terminal HTH domain [Devosia crocina]